MEFRHWVLAVLESRRPIGNPRLTEGNLSTWIDNNQRDKTTAYFQVSDSCHAVPALGLDDSWQSLFPVNSRNQVHSSIPETGKTHPTVRKSFQVLG
jgi:hypothetical protein